MADTPAWDAAALSMQKGALCPFAHTQLETSSHKSKERVPLNTTFAGFSAMGYATAQTCCLYAGRECYGDSKIFLCDDYLLLLWKVVSCLRFFFNVQMYAWPLLLLIVMKMWVQQGIATVQRWYALCQVFAVLAPNIWCDCPPKEDAT